MASYVEIELDVTAPSSPTVSIAGGAATTNTRDVSLDLSAAGSPAQMKIYGDVDDAFATSEYRALEANAPWITYATSKSVRLAAVDGTKTVKVKYRDDVWNVSAEATDTISLDTSVPTVTATGLSTPKISKQTGKRTATFDFESDQDVVAWKVKVVPATNSTHTEGTQIPTAGGSTGVTGTTLADATPQEVSIDGADLETAGAEANNIVKVFVQNAAGTWSI